MKDSKIIKVLNRRGSSVVLHGVNRDYTIGAGTEKRPASMLIAYEDIDHINSNTDVFRSGRLEFEEAEAADIHEMLGNTDVAQTCFDAERIRDIILNPTYEKAEEVLGITSISVMERFRSELLKIKARGVYPVAPNIDRVVTGRYKEVNDGVRKTKITISSPQFERVPTEVDKLEDTIRELKEKIAALEAANMEREAEKAPVKRAAPVKKTADPQKAPAE